MVAFCMMILLVQKPGEMGDLLMIEIVLTSFVGAVKSREPYQTVVAVGHIVTPSLLMIMQIQLNLWENLAWGLSQRYLDFASSLHSQNVDMFTVFILNRFSRTKNRSNWRATTNRIRMKTNQQRRGARKKLYWKTRDRNRDFNLVNSVQILSIRAWWQLHSLSSSSKVRSRSPNVWCCSNARLFRRMKKNHRLLISLSLRHKGTLLQKRTQVWFELPSEIPLAHGHLMKMLSENLIIKKIYWGNLLLAYLYTKNSTSLIPKIFHQNLRWL